MNRYIFRQMLVTLILVTAALVAVIWLSHSLKFVELIVNRGLSAPLFLYMTVLILPGFLVIMLPIAMFTAVLFTYNKLISDNEVIVLRATGVSPGTLATPALMLGALVVIAMYGLTVYVMPTAFREFKDLESVVRDQFAQVVLQEGVFNTLSKDITVFVRERQSSGELSGILVHDARDPEKPVTMMAQSGALISGEGGPRVLMVNGTRQAVRREGGPLSLLYFDRYVFEIAAAATPAGERWRDPKERYLHELFFPLRDADKVFSFHRLRMEGHYRLTTPLFGLAFAMIGLACLLTGEFSRRGQVGRIIFAALWVVLVESAALTIKGLGVKYPAVSPLMYANVIIPILIGAYLLFRPSRLRRIPAVPAAPADRPQMQAG